MAIRARAFQRIEAFIARDLLAPLVVCALRLVALTWRLRGPSDEEWRTVLAPKRVMFATYHGMFLQLLAFSHFPPAHGRKLVVLTGPGFAGMLIAGIVGRFGLDHVRGMSGRRGIGGSLEFIRRLKAGDAGVVAVDGPRGPCCVAKPGFMKIAARANTHIIVMLTSARPGLVLGSWDRMHLPAPFARVEATVQLLPPPATERIEVELPRVERTLLDTSIRMGSSVVPRELVESHGQG